MTKMLDKSRNFGMVYGSTIGEIYYQDGLCFRGDGTCVDEPASLPETAPVSEPESPATDNGTGVSREQLQALHPAKIKKMVEMAGIPLETGTGSKARNIENLIAAG